MHVFRFNGNTKSFVSIETNFVSNFQLMAKCMFFVSIETPIVLFPLLGAKNWEIYFFEGEIQVFWSLSVGFHAERSQLAETERSEAQQGRSEA